MKSCNVFTINTFNAFSTDDEHLQQNQTANNGASEGFGAIMSLINGGYRHN